MILPLVYYGDPFLRKKSIPVTEVTDDVRQLVRDLIETVHSQRGVGLSCPQVRREEAIFVVCDWKRGPEGEWIPFGEKAYINLKILEHSQELGSENQGCLSIPGIYMDVFRPLKIKFQYMDLEGKTHIEEAEGYDAQVIMHENDHLNGVLFIDRLTPKERSKIEPKLREIKKKYAHTYK